MKLSNIKSIIKKNRFLYRLLLKSYEMMKRLKDRQYREVCRFFDKNGNEMLKECSLLNENSVIFELGGYKGDWAESMYQKYFCNCYVFEPVKEYYHAILQKLQDEKKVHIYNMGIGTASYETMISVSNDGSSIYDNNGEEKIKIKSFEEFLSENQIRKIDLLQINIEGGGI